jgi:hypothetical protein
MTEMKRQMLRDMGYDEWSVTRTGVLECPCGHRVEDDGECPEGHESPLREMGMI